LPGRDRSSPKTQIPRLNENTSKEHQVSSRARLGESLSLERDNASLKTRALRLGEVLEQNLGESQLLSPRRDELAWARMTVLATVTRMQQKHIPKNNIPEHKQTSFIRPKHPSSIQGIQSNQKHGEMP